MLDVNVYISLEQEGDISKDYLSGLLLKQLDEVEDAEMLISRVLVNPNTKEQERKYWLEEVPSSASETSGSAISVFFVAL